MKNPSCKIAGNRKPRGLRFVVFLAGASVLALGGVLALASSGTVSAPRGTPAPDLLDRAKIAIADEEWLTAENLLRTLSGKEARALLGRTLLERGACEEAAKVFGEVLKEDANSFEALRGMALANKCLGRPEAASAYFMRAAQIRKDDPRVWRELGLCQQRAGDTIGAISSIQQSLRLAPDQRELSNNLGDLARGPADPGLSAPAAWRGPGADQASSRPLDPSSLAPQSRLPAANSNPLRIPGRNR